MEKRDFEGTTMQSKNDFQLNQLLAGRWGQFMDSRRTGVRLVFGLMLLVSPALTAWASTDVTAANYNSNAAGDVVITLSTDGDEPKVSVFATESPARIILDLADTSSQVDASPVSVGIGSVQTFTTLAAGGRTRVMVDLSRPVTYDYQSGNGQVVLSISGSGTGSTAPRNYGTEKHTVTNVDFRRGEDGQSKVIEKSDGLRLVIGYSQKRANKDRHNRERGLKKLEKKIRTGKLSKANINNRGYNKYLKLEGEITVSIDFEKYSLDQKWDGLKGYLTNTSLTKEQIIENYGQLWKIEKAFRISKHDLRIRPIFHRVKRRIEAHICIAFVAYKVYKELERQLKEKRSGLSPGKAIEIAKTIYRVSVQTPKHKHRVGKTILITDEQKNLANLFDF